jgi:hypothetical protein
MYLSIGLNFIFLIAFITLLIYYLKLKREDREFEAEIQRRLHPSVRVDRFTGQVGPFSLGSLDNLLQDHENERQPLLRSAAQTIGGGLGQENPTYHSNESSVSDDTFLRRRTENLSMKTFKPDANEKLKPEIAESRV